MTNHSTSSSAKSSSNRTAPGSDRVKQRRKHIDQRLQSLYQRVSVLEKELQKIEDPRFYRCCIFGSARIKPDDKIYREVTELAKLLAEAGIDILTGGGPGLMEAANLGARSGRGDGDHRSLSIGLPIELDFEPLPNQHLDIKRHHKKFSSRLDDFMRLSHSIVVTQGGIGTLLELFFAWQLIQVRHLSPRPIVLMDSEFWSGLVSWMKDYPLARKLVSAPDFENITIVNSPEEAFEVIEKHRQELIRKREKSPQKAEQKAE